MSFIMYMKQPGILIFLLMTDIIILSTAGNSGVDALVSVFLLYLHVAYMYFYVCVSCPSTVSATERVSQQVQTPNTLTCLTHSAPEPLTEALYCS